MSGRGVEFHDLDVPVSLLGLADPGGRVQRQRARLSGAPAHRLAEQGAASGRARAGAPLSQEELGPAAQLCTVGPPSHPWPLSSTEKGVRTLVSSAFPQNFTIPAAFKGAQGLTSYGAIRRLFHGILSGLNNPQHTVARSTSRLWVLFTSPF